MSTANTPQIVQSLYSDHHGWLHSWLRKKLGCTHSAADLAQDTFLRLLGQRQALDLSQSRALLTHIAKGLMVDYWRRLDVERAYLEAIARSWKLFTGLRPCCAACLLKPWKSSSFPSSMD